MKKNLAATARLFFVLLLLLFIGKPLFLFAQIKVYNTGQAFTCIAVDAGEGIWAGTSKAGVYSLDDSQKKTASNFTKRPLGSLDNFNIQTIAGGFNGSLWIGHNGNANTGAAGGGIDEINTKTYSFIKHYATDRNAECFSFFERDGLGSSNSACIRLDKRGTVWSAQKYHDLLVTGTPGSPAQYILTPGTLSFKRDGNKKFFSLSTYEDYKVYADLPELPYPAYTCNPSPSQTPYSRNCYAVGVGNDAVWVSVAPYLAKNLTFYPARILKFSLDGFYANKSFSLASMGYSGAGIFNGIYVAPNGKVWVTMTTGKVLVYDGIAWDSVEFPLSFPSGIFPNYNAITGDTHGNVYIGTNKGLVVYNGKALHANSSFKIYTEAEGLLSANVKGVTIDESGAVWMATENGIAKIQSYPFTVYNLSHPVPGKEKQAAKFALVSATDVGLQPNGDPVEVNIAADSSRTTMIVYTGGDLENKKLVFAGRELNQSYTDEKGELVKLDSKDDSLVFVYHHPAFVKDGESKKFVAYDFALKDVVINKTVVEGKVNIYHAPVLMVHGVWSRAKAMDSMTAYLLNTSGNFEAYQLLAVWEKSTNHKEYTNGDYVFRQKIPEGIDQLLLQCRNNFLSAGKADIVAHSRGGLYSRYYLQSTFKDMLYRNDIRALITINTPHSGSQAANLMLDRRKLIPGGPDFLRLGKLLSPMFLDKKEGQNTYDDIEGAYELRVDDPGLVRDLNSAPNLNRNMVPSHTITSEYRFGAFSKPDLYKTLYINLLTRVPYVGTAIAVLRIYALSLGTLCVDGPLDFCLREIYKEANDIVVPLRSQRGGLDDQYTSKYSDKLAHSQKDLGLLAIHLPATLDAEETQKKVSELLREKVTDEKSSHFTSHGFHPVDLSKTYSFLPLLPGNPATGKMAAAKVTIDPALKGQTFQHGQTVQVAVTGSPEIKTLLISYDGTSLSETASDVEPAASFVFPYPVPKEAIGKVMLTAFGFNDNGLVAVDTSYINVGLGGASLDSIRIQKDENGQIRVPARDSVQLLVMGYFSDTVRRLASLSGLNFSLRSSGVAKTTYPDWLVGILPGKTDQLYANYLGKTDTVSVLVTDSIPVPTVVASPLPVSLKSFTAAYKNRQVGLQWTTAQETANKEFEVQYSTGGGNFEPIGRVSGKGTTNEETRYSFATTRYTNGKNFYRLKQTDLNGNYAYSPVALVTVDEQHTTSIGLFPNPAKDQLVMMVNGFTGASLQLTIAEISGRKLWTKALPGNTNTVSLSLPKLSAGLYVVSVTTGRGEKLLTEKLVIQ